MVISGVPVHGDVSGIGATLSWLRKPFGLAAFVEAVRSITKFTGALDEQSGARGRRMLVMPQFERGARVRLPPPLAFVGFVLAGVGLRYAVGPLRVPLEPAIRLAIGLLVQTVALVLVGSARRLFFRTKQNPSPWTPSPQLILAGPYRWTRNPMYVGVTAFELGLGVTLDNLWISLLAAPALVLVHFAAVLPEERYLTEKFGEPYLRYVAQVRRYL